MADRRRNNVWTYGSLLPLCFLIVLAAASATYSQKLDFQYKTFNLEQDEFNVIQNAGHLDDFFELLHSLKSTGKNKINIVHIGDSHIQADFLTSVVRKNFQRDFGDAGRGLVVPGRVAGTNEPSNIRTSSTVHWLVKRLIYPDQPLPIGVGGITILTNEANVKLQLKMTDPIHDYRFNAVTLFFQKNKSSFDFSIRDTTDTELGFIDADTEEPFVNYSRVLFPRLVNNITIQTIKTTDEQNQATLFGINLENGNEGILYHNIGVNGAKYAHYNAALYFAKQTQGLLPDVFIISLGTNESIEYPYIDRAFYQKIDKLVVALREYNPQAKFILVTPPPAFRKKIKPNPGTQIIREQIIQYAVENGLAFWDMYKACGGPGAAQAWRNDGLLRPDGIHFTKEGYEYQGNLLYNAFVKSYNNYVPFRHP